MLNDDADETGKVTVFHETASVRTDTASAPGAVLGAYLDRLVELRAGLTAEQSTRLYSLVGVWACIALTLGVIVTAAFQGTAPLTLAIFTVAGLLAFYRRYVTSGKRWSLLVQEIDYFERGVLRLTDTWQGQGEAGTEFAREGHLYQSDLHILGRGSLFELLCTTRSTFGAERLAAFLLDPVEQEESRRRQTAVKELQGTSHLREQMHRLGDHRSHDAGLNSFCGWFEMTPFVIHPAFRYLLLLSSTACVVLTIGFFSKALLWSDWAPLLSFLVVVQLATAGVLLKHIRPRLRQLRLLTSSFTVLHQALSLLEQQHFEAPKLRELTERVQSTHASAKVRAIEKLARLLDQREKLGFYAVALALVVATQLVLAMEHWRRVNQVDFMGWVDAWAEFEALQALAGYAFEQTCTVFPELVHGAAVYHATQLGHPLLETARCVCNDVGLDMTRASI